MIEFKFAKRAFLAFFGIFPYKIAHRLILFIFSRKKMSIYIWCRNSYELGYLEPGYSDLDLTIYCTNDKYQKVAFNIKKNIEKLKKIAPIIGEVNCYISSDFNKISHNFNYFEILRDPLLLKHITNVDRKNIRSQAIVFILKQLESDISMLNKYPIRRVKKWNYIYSSLSDEIPEADLLNKIPFNKDKILETMICIVLHLMKIFANNEFQILYKQIDFYFLLLFKKIDMHKVPDVFRTDALGFLLFFDKIQSSDIELKKLNIFQLDILNEKIKWEIIGNYSQKTNVEFIQKQILHLQNIYFQVIRTNLQGLDKNLDSTLQSLKSIIDTKVII